MMPENFKSSVEKIHNLPTIPKVAQEILNLTNDSTLSIDNIINIVGKDPAIMAKILSVANSSFFRIAGQTTTLHDAMMRIGLNNVKSIAIGLSLLTLLGADKKTSDYVRLFNHSLFVGFNARAIAKNLKMSIAEDILMEGLLHDLGYLVLNKYFPDQYTQILKKLENEESILDAERDIIHNTHADVGYWLADKWSLPETILDTNLYHHTPSLAKRNEKHVGVVHIADYITSKNNHSPIDREPGYTLDQSSLDLLSISDNDLKDIEHNIHKTSQNTESGTYN